MNPVERWRHEVSQGDVTDSGRFNRVANSSIGFGLRVVAKFQDRKLHLQSTSLAYTTLLSLVPFLAVTFSVLKGFGVQDQLEPILMQSLEPLGEQGVEIGQYILRYVDNLNFAVLGFMGITLLFWMVISLLTKVEEAFNAIWHVAGVRSWGRRFSDYLSVALVGPVFLFAALGVTTMALGGDYAQWLAGIQPFGMLILGLSRLIPYLLVCAAFAFLYAFLTNYPVRLVPALVGGIFAGVAWYGVGQLFAHLIAGSSKYSAIYSSLAAAVLFIMWVNIGWLILLVGAYVARYWQHPHLLRFGSSDGQEGQIRDEALALDLMTLVGHAYYFDEPKWTLASLAAHGCCGSPDQVKELVQSLQTSRLIVATNDEPEALLPARSLETIRLQEIVAATRGRGNNASRLPQVQAVVERIDSAVSGSLEGKTLKDLVLAGNGSGAQTAVRPEDRNEAV